MAEVAGKGDGFPEVCIRDRPFLHSIGGVVQGAPTEEDVDRASVDRTGIAVRRSNRDIHAAVLVPVEPHGHGAPESVFGREPGKRDIGTRVQEPTAEENVRAPSVHHSARVGGGGSDDEIGQAVPTDVGPGCEARAELVAGPFAEEDEVGGCVEIGGASEKEGRTRPSRSLGAPRHADQEVVLAVAIVVGDAAERFPKTLVDVACAENPIDVRVERPRAAPQEKHAALPNARRANGQIVVAVAIEIEKGERFTELPARGGPFEEEIGDEIRIRSS
jgi:hypothetical protein